jgi:hypothetical protein
MKENEIRLGKKLELFWKEVGSCVSDDFLKKIL